MIQDIYPSRFHLDYSLCDIEDDDYVIVANRNKEICLINNDIPRYSQVKDRLKGTFRFLFSIDDDHYFMNYETLEDEEYVRVRNAIKILSDKQAFACSTGYHLYTWYSTHRYCGRCSHELVPHEKERALRCPECGQMYYPVILPAVIVGVTNGDKILMSVYAGREYKSFALIAGFCEIGESGEDTCRREVMEEVGLKIKNIRYFDSQPWGVDSDLLLGYFAELDGDDTIHVDHDELAEAMWVSYKDIEENNDLKSLTQTMIQAFRRSFSS